MTPTREQIEIQLRLLHMSGMDELLSSAAQANGFSPAFLYAIASRETNCLNKLGDWQQTGSSDVGREEAHGVGIVQIDIQNPIARQARDDGSWRTNPGPLIEFGAKLLADDIAAARTRCPQATATDILQMAADAYNTGLNRELRRVGQNLHDANPANDNKADDGPTTGHDYGRDVIARMAMFADLMAQNPGGQVNAATAG